MGTRALLLTTVSLLLLSCASSTPSLESYRGQALLPWLMGDGRNQPVQVSITRWTTDDEHRALLEVLESGGSRAMSEALFKAEETGFVTFGGRSTFRMRYARAYESGGKRTVIIATDRPIYSAEAASPGARTLDYPISVIVLETDETGSGSGFFSVGTQITFSEKTNQLILENYSTEPVRLTAVTRVD